MNSKLLIVLLLGCINAKDLILDTGWVLRNQNNTIRIPNVSLPSCVHLEVQQQDPHFRFRELDLKWIAYEQWTYYIEFNISETIPANLLLQQIDTIAEITLNGRILGWNRNLFLPQTFAIQLNEQLNRLEIRIHPALLYAEQQERI